MLYNLNLTEIPEVRMPGRIRQPSGWCNKGRTAQVNMMIIITDGNSVFSANGSIVHLEKGDCLLLPAGTFYVASCEEACEYIFIHFITAKPIKNLNEVDAAQINKQLKNKFTDYKGMFPYSLPPTIHDGVFINQKTSLGAQRDNIMHLVSKCEGYRYETHLNKKLRIDLYFSQLTLALSVDTMDGITAVSSSMPATLSKILIYIQQNYSRSLTLQELSDTFQLSKQYIIRMFHCHLNTTVTQYINTLKLFHSLELLKYSTMKVGEVAEVLGFSSTYYFCRLFKRAYRLTPSEYIKSEMGTL